MRTSKSKRHYQQELIEQKASLLRARREIAQLQEDYQKEKKQREALDMNHLARAFCQIINTSKLDDGTHLVAMIEAGGTLSQTQISMRLLRAIARLVDQIKL